MTDSIDAIPQPEQGDAGHPDQGGVPLWLPLLFGIIAIAFAIFIGTRICPTLSAIVSPPDPVLPYGSVLESRESKGTEDQWYYSVKAPACDVAAFYKKAYGDCNYDPGVDCSGKKQGVVPPGMPLTIARCGGDQQIAQFNITWYVVISDRADKDGTTTFRVFREVH